MKIISTFLIFFCFSIFVYGKDISIYAAISVKPAIEEIKEVFEKEKGVKVNIYYGSSGKGFAQLKNGAKYDIFISADTFYPEKILEYDLASSEPKIYGIGKLTLVFSERFLKNREPNLIILKEANKIAIANPKLAPYGRASVEFLKKQGYTDILNNKTVYGENLSNVLQYVENAFVDAGFLSYSIVIHNKNLQNRALVISDNNYEPIKQAMILTKHSNSNKNAKDFFNFILSTSGKKILKKYGF